MTRTLMAMVMAVLALGSLSCATTSGGGAPNDIPKADPLERDLLSAIAGSDEERIDELLQEGAALNRVTEMGLTPLAFAIGKADDETVAFLLQQGAKPNFVSSENRTALMFACAMGRHRVVKMLVGAGAEVRVMDDRGYTPLILSIASGERLIIDFLLRNGADPNHVPEEGLSAVAVAVLSGKNDVLGQLIDHGANVNLTASNGVTPLMLAAANNRPDLMEMLAGAGADRRREDREHNSALIWAARAGSAQAIGFLLAENWEREVLEKTYLKSCEHGHEAAAAVLLGNGVEVDAVDANGWTCLMLSIWGDHEALVDTVVAAGAKVTAGSHDDWTPLMTAAAWGRSYTAKRLVDLGADPQRADKLGHTALSVSERNGHYETNGLLRGHCGLQPVVIAATGQQISLEQALECPVEVANAQNTDPTDEPFVFGPVLWHPADFPRRWGHRGWANYSQVRSSKAVPVEVCSAQAQYEWVAALACDDGSRPFENVEQARGARVGSVGGGGRCGKVVDLYRVSCPEGVYEIYMDLNHCPKVPATESWM